MKKTYSKPTVYVEVMRLDMPIAANCVADKADMLSLIDLGYFTAEKNCMVVRDDVTNPIIVNGHDTICYNSNVQVAFLS